MEINIRNIGPDEQEYFEIGCHKVDSNINDIVRFIKSRQGVLEGTKGEKIYRIPLVDIYYIEAVDDKTFIYMKDECYESNKRLYEFESVLSSREYARISKSVIVNMMKIDSIRPALNGRFLCLLDSGEKVIISRKYVPDIKERLKG